MSCGIIITKPLQATITYPDGIMQNFYYPERRYNVTAIAVKDDGKRLFITDEQMTELHPLVVHEDLVKEYIPCAESAVPSIGVTPN